MSLFRNAELQVQSIAAIVGIHVSDRQLRSKIHEWMANPVHPERLAIEKYGGAVFELLSGKLVKKTIAGLVAVTSLSPKKDRQADVLDSWVKAGLKIVCIQQAAEVDDLASRYKQVADWIAVEEWESRYARRTVLISDMAKVAMTHRTKVMLINSDIEILAGEASFVAIERAVASDSLTIGIRWNYASDFSTAVRERSGVDVFFVDPKQAELLQGRPYEIGHPTWDYWLPSTLSAAGYRIEEMQERIFFHREHELAWTVDEWMMGRDWMQSELGVFHDWQHVRDNLFDMRKSIVIVCTGADLQSIALRLTGGYASKASDYNRANTAKYHIVDVDAFDADLLAIADRVFCSSLNREWAAHATWEFSAEKIETDVEFVSKSMASALLMRTK